MRTKSKLTAALRTCVEILESEGLGVKVSTLREAIRTRFPDVIEQNSRQFLDSGISSEIRRELKHLRRDGGMNGRHIQMSLQFENLLPEFIPVPVSGLHAHDTDWKHLSDCTVPDLDLCLSHLRRQEINDRNRSRDIRRLRARLVDFTRETGNTFATVTDLVNSIPQS